MRKNLYNRNRIALAATTLELYAEAPAQGINGARAAVQWFAHVVVQLFARDPTYKDEPLKIHLVDLVTALLYLAEILKIAEDQEPGSVPGMIVPLRLFFRDLRALAAREGLDFDKIMRTAELRFAKGTDDGQTEADVPGKKGTDAKTERQAFDAPTISQHASWAQDALAVYWQNPVHNADAAMAALRTHGISAEDNLVSPYDTIVDMVTNLWHLADRTRLASDSNGCAFDASDHVRQIREFVASLRELAISQNLKWDTVIERATSNHRAEVADEDEERGDSLGQSSEWFFEVARRGCKPA